MSDWSDEPDDDEVTDADYERFLEFRKEKRKTTERIARQLSDVYGTLHGYAWVPSRSPTPTVVGLAEWARRMGVTFASEPREYEPTDEDRRMLSEMGIEA